MSISILDQGNSFGILTTTSSTGVITAFVFDTTGLGNIGIGTTTFTGTANQALQVGTGAYIAGSVGIGTTTPSSALSVVGDGRFTGILTATGLSALSGVSSFASGTTVLIGAASSSGTANQALQVTGKSYFSDRVGIGTTNPLSQLFVTQASSDSSTGESATHAIALSSGNNGRTMWMGYDDTIDAGYINAAKTGASRPIYMQTRNVTGSSQVFVGIGTTAPTGTVNQPLQVTGGAYVSGNLGVANTLPGVQLEVVGNTRVTGVSTAARFSATTGISSFSSGTTVLIGTGTSTGITGQALQVAGAAGSSVYIGGNVAIGATTISSFVTLLDNASTGIGLSVLGGGSGSPIARFERVIGATGSSIDIHASSSTPQVRFTRAGVTTFSVGFDNNASPKVFAIANDANLGANTRLVIDLTGNIGIGTSIPTQLFHVGAASSGTVVITGFGSVGIGTTNPIGQLQVSSGPVIIGAATSTGTTGQVLQVAGINSSAYIGGNLGVGITNPSYKLHVVGNIKATTDIDTDTQFLGQPSDTQSTPSYSWTSDTTTGFYRPSSGNLGFTINGTEALRLNVNGVGIGTTNPRGQLQVSSGPVIIGAATSTGTASQTLQVTGGAYVSGNLGIGITNPQSTLSVGGTITELYGGTYWNLVSQYDVGIGASQVPLNQFFGQLAYMDSYSPSGLRRDGGGSDDIVVTSDGLIGIGSTNPGSKLTVNGDVYISGILTAGSFSQLNNLGIGSTAPTVQLDVVGNAKISGILTTGSLSVGIGTTIQSPIGVLQVGVGTTSVVITGFGSVGVGTTNPASRLDVIGEIRSRRIDTIQEGGQLTLTRAVDDSNAYAIDVFGSADATSRLRIIDTIAGSERLTVNRTGNIGIGTTIANQLIQVGSGGTNSVVVTDIGSVGIGTTTPLSALSVVGDARLTGVVTARGLNATSGISSFAAGSTVLIGTGTSTGTANQALQVAGVSSNVYIGGNVAIGVTFVTAPATVSIAGTLGISESNGTGSRTLFASSASGFLLNHNDNSAFIFQFQSNERLRVSNLGNVGIGTTLNLTGALVTVNGGLLITNSNNTIGYGTGTGGVVTQLTGKTTGVTLSRPSGNITLAAGQMTTGIVSSFTLTNTVIDSSDVLILNHVSGGTLGAYTLNARAGAGSATIDVRNVTAGTLNEQPVIRFVVIKGAIS